MVQVIGKQEIIKNFGISRVFEDMQEMEFFGEIETTNGQDCSVWIAEEPDDNSARVRRLMLVTGNARVLMNEAQADEFIRTLQIARNELAKMNG